MENIIMKFTTDHGNTIELVVTEVENHNEVSQYARWYDDSCPGWTKDEWFNRSFITHQERYLNDVLRVRGHLYLNEVYDCLGMARTRAGQLIGWIYEKGKSVKISIIDSRPDDGMVNGLSSGLLLDFNVDGIIIDKMRES